MSKELFLSHLNKYLRKPEPGIEVELRLGRLMEKATGTRIALAAHYPVIMDPAAYYYFDPKIDPFLWTRLKSNWKCSAPSRDIVRIQHGVRFIFVDGKLVKTERKHRIADFDIYVPKSEFDLRLSISTEQNVANVSLNKSVRLAAERKRERESVVLGKFRIDFTDVNGHKELEIELLEEATAEELWQIAEQFWERLKI